MRKGSTFVLVAATLLFGCGGSGDSTPGAEIQDQVQSFDLGIVRGDVPTTMAISVAKPLYPAATIELEGVPTGAFEPYPGTFPMAVDSGPDVTVWITFTPPAAPSAEEQQGTIPLLFRRASGGEAIPVTLKLQARTEKPSVRLLQTQVNAGNAAVGETVKFGVSIENTSAATPIVVTDVTPPDGEFAMAPDAVGLPIEVAPGSRFVVRLAYTPKGEWAATSFVRVYHSVADTPLEASVVGTGIAPLIVTEFGYVPLDPMTSESDWLTLDVPAEGVSIFIEAWGDPYASLVDLIGLEGPSGQVYENYDMTGPLEWLSNYPAGARGYLNVELPDSNLPDVHLATGGGTYRFRVRDSAWAVGGLYVRATVSQRRAGTVREGTLNVNVFLADGLAITSRSDPMSDPKVAAVLRTIDAILGSSSARLGAISFTFMDPYYNTVADEAEMEALVANNTFGLEEGALNLFLLNDIGYLNSYGYGIRAIAGAVPGSMANGTPYSGVVADFDEADGNTVGATAAHEIVHYLGAEGETLHHPLLSPGLPADILSPPESTNYSQIDAIFELLGPEDMWCGACTRAPLR